MVITASRRAAAVHARPRAGMDCASSLQRCRVPAPTPTSRATTSKEMLLGGSKRATALSLNVCPYRAISIFQRRPKVLGSIGATTSLTQGGLFLVFGIFINRPLPGRRRLPPPVIGGKANPNGKKLSWPNASNWKIPPTLCMMPTPAYLPTAWTALEKPCASWSTKSLPY